MATATACSLEPLKIDPCSVLNDTFICHAVPINQPEKPEYDRQVVKGDIVLSAEDYAKTQKFSREVLRICKALRQACGDRCLGLDTCD